MIVSSLYRLGILLVCACWLMGCHERGAPSLATPEPPHNLSTVAGVALGRRLFYDPVLSGNSQVACASCHRQSMAFADGMALSTSGVSGKALLRHAPSLVNTAWAQGLFWDGGATNLESLVFGPIAHPDEMAQTLKDLPAKLAQRPEYPPLFQAAFGTDSITVALVARALAQFQRSIVSFNSRFDRYLLLAQSVDTGQASAQIFSANELAGLAVFGVKCASCHPPPTFTDYLYHNNGLDAHFPANDGGIYLGRFRISGDSAEMGQFKTPTLRNVAITAPYMHDGRFATLAQVVAHYAQGMKKSSTLEKNFRQGNHLGLDLSPREQIALISFLNTLTDSSLLQNTTLSNPFVQPPRSH